MKRIFAIFTCAMITMLLLVGCKQESGPTIGVVDMERAYQSNKATASIMKYLEAKQAPLAVQVNAALEAMKKDQNEETVKAYNQVMSSAQATMQMEQQRLVPILNEAFNKVLEEYRAKKGLTVILNKQMAPAVAESADVTDDIIAAMDLVELNLEPAAPEAPAAEAAPVAETTPTDEAAPAAEPAPEGETQQ